MNVNTAWGLTRSEYRQYYIINNAFSNSDIKDINDIGNELNQEKGIVANKDYNNFRDTIIAWIPSNNNNYVWLFSKLTDIITQVNNMYFKFDLHSIQNLQYSIYNEGCFYKKHYDISPFNPNNGMRKLSFSLQLSEESDYEGGDVILHNENSGVRFPRSKGTLAFFPSYTPHEVTPITKGTRRALVGWVQGPNFK